jgi:hypothetical protein
MTLDVPPTSVFSQDVELKNTAVFCRVIWGRSQKENIINRTSKITEERRSGRERICFKK